MFSTNAYNIHLYTQCSKFHVGLNGFLTLTRRHQIVDRHRGGSFNYLRCNFKKSTWLIVSLPS